MAVSSNFNTIGGNSIVDELVGRLRVSFAEHEGCK